MKTGLPVLAVTERERKSAFYVSLPPGRHYAQEFVGRHHRRDRETRRRIHRRSAPAPLSHRYGGDKGVWITLEVFCQLAYISKRRVSVFFIMKAVEDQSMTIRYAIAVFEKLMIDVLSLFDSLLVFSFLFAVLFLALACLQVVCGLVIKKNRSRIIPLLIVAAFAMQYTSFGNSVVFLLMDAYSILQYKAGLWRQWPLALAFVWLSGATANLALIAIGYWGVRRELSRCPDYRDDESVARACSTALITHSVKIKARKKGREVASWGILSPSILVPADFSERFKPEERYWIYLHELSHWKRRDSLRSLVLVLWRACFWFDPICRKAVQCIRHDFELACDQEVVVNHGADALEYSRLIVKTAALQCGMTIGFASGYQNIKDRIGQLLDNGVAIGKRRRIIFGVLFVAILTATLVWQHFASRATIRYVRTHNFTHWGKNGIKREFMSEIHGTYGIFGAYTDPGHTIQEIERRDLRGPDSHWPELT